MLGLLNGIVPGVTFGSLSLENMKLIGCASQGHQEREGQNTWGPDWLGCPEILVKRLVMCAAVKPIRKVCILQPRSRVRNFDVPYVIYSKFSKS